MPWHYCIRIDRSGNCVLNGRCVGEQSTFVANPWDEWWVLGCRVCISCIHVSSNAIGHYWLACAATCSFSNSVSATIDRQQHFSSSLFDGRYICLDRFGGSFHFRLSDGFRHGYRSRRHAICLLVLCRHLHGDLRLWIRTVAVLPDNTHQLDHGRLYNPIIFRTLSGAAIRKPVSTIRNFWHTALERDNSSVYVLMQDNWPARKNWIN